MQIFLASLVAIGLAFLLYRRYVTSEEQLKRYPHELFAPVVSLLDGPEIHPTETIGTHLLTGQYKSHPIQIKTIVDTLNTRKLPSLWLMITIPQPTPITCTFDVMMRPTGPSTFSNFDDLPHTIATPANFPPEAVLRSSSAVDAPPVSAIQSALQLFSTWRGKELLVSPKGVRIVLQAAEATRARYGVFRQADFGDFQLDPALTKAVIEILITLHSDLSGKSQ